MTGPDREERSLALLLRAAKASVDDLQARLADLETARRSAEASLDWLAQAVGAEEAARGGDAAAVHDFARYLDGAAQKRAALTATRDTLAAEIENLRAPLLEAFAELKKFEHLIEITRRAARRDAAKAEAGEADAASAMRRSG